MFNVIFYDGLETTTTSSGQVITTRVPSRYVCTTMTSANSFYKGTTMQKFVGSFPALSSASNMFEGSEIQCVKDVKQVEDESGEGYRDDDIPADFGSLLNASFMFSDCRQLKDINIDLKSLVYAEDIFAGCIELTSISGNMNSLINGDGLFSDCGKLETFNVTMDNIESADSMFAGTSVSTVYTFDSLESARAMYKNCSKLSSAEVNFPSLIDADMMFAGSSLSSIIINAPKLFNGEQMFYKCPSLSSVNCNFDSLNAGDEMFYDCDSLGSARINAPKMRSAVRMFNASSTFHTFTGDLRGLKDGTEMFKSTAITAFSPMNLDSLEIGNGMFFGNNFRTWNIDLPHLTSGGAMFAGSIMPAYNTGLTSFTADLSLLQNGYQMFLSSSYLTDFNSGLPSLTNGIEMFKGCKLSPQSIMYIVESLPTYTDKTATIDLGINATSATLDEFARETGLYSSFAEIKEILQNKGWKANWWDSSVNAIS